MSEYPEALVEKVARALLGAHMPNVAWSHWSDDTHDHYKKLAAAALDALGLREESLADVVWADTGEPHFTVALRRYVTDWEDV